MELSVDEQDAIRVLTGTGLDFRAASIIVVMAGRTAGARSRTQLIDNVLSGYPGLEDRAAIGAIVDRLRDQGWLEETNINGTNVWAASSDITPRLEKALGKDLAARIRSFRDVTSKNLVLIGPIYSPLSSETVTSSIQSAHGEVRMPFLGTPATVELANYLEDRARQGVRIRLLLASSDLVAHLRGEANRERGAYSVRGWIDRTATWPNTELRVTSNPHHMLFAASVSFDDDHLLLAVFDVDRQRSHQGTVLDVRQTGYVPNLVVAFNRHFDSAWLDARPVVGPQRFWWWSAQGVRLGGLAASVGVTFAFLTAVPAISNVAAGIAATLILTETARGREGLRRLIRRVRGIR